MADLPRERSFAFAAKIQAGGRGVPAGATMAADAIRLASSFEVTMDWISRGEMDGEQAGAKGTYASGEKSGRIFKFPVRRRMRGPGVVYDANTWPEEDPLLMAILGTRNVDTTPGAEQIEYSGTDGDEPLIECVAESLTKKFLAIDCVPSSASIQWEATKFIELVVEMMGVGSAPTQQVLEAAVLDTVIPPVGKGGIFTVDGVALKPIKGTLDFGLQNADPILDGTAGDGWSGNKITDRAPTGNFEIQVEDLAYFDPYDLCATSSKVAWVMEHHAAASAQYNNVRLEADKLEIKDVKQVNRGGILAWSIDYKINRATSPSVKDPVVIYK